MTSSRATRGRLTAVLVVTIIAALVAAVVTILHGGKADVGEGVTIEGDDLPGSLFARTDTQVEPPPFGAPGLLEPVGPIREIGPGGKLQEPVTVTLPLDREVSADANVEKVMVAYKSTKDDPWTWAAQPVTLTDDRRHVTFTADHFSWYQPFIIATQLAVKMLWDGLLDKMSYEVFSSPGDPYCAGKSLVDVEGYSIKWQSPQSQGKDHALAWCYGVMDGRQVLKVVNKRPYPVEIDQTDLSPITWGKDQFDLVKFYRQGYDLIRAGDTAIFELNLAEGNKGTLNAHLSNWALGFDASQKIMELIIELAFKAKLISTSVKEFTSMPLPLKCLQVVPNLNLGEIVRECFNEATLATRFGANAAVLAPVMMAFGLIDMGEAIVHAVNDRKSDRDKYGLTVDRSKKAELGRFVGNWYRHGEEMNINSDATGDYSFREEAAETIDIDAVMNGQSIQMVHVHADLTFASAPDGKGVIGTYRNVRWTRNETAIPEPAVLEGQTFRDGDQVRLEVDSSTRLKMTWLGRISFMNERSQGAPYNTDLLCGKATPQMARETCGA